MKSILKIKLHATLMLLVIIGFHLLLDHLYRPLQFKSGHFDLGFAGSFTQITASIGIAMLMIIRDTHQLDHAAALQRQRYFYSVVPVFAMTAYELVQIWYPIATFDATDLLYCLLALMLTDCSVRLVLFSTPLQKST